VFKSITFFQYFNKRHPAKMMLTISLDKMNSAKRILLTAGAILSFAILFGLFCLIFYQLFKPNSQASHFIIIG
jgi:hypothetical protein